MSEQQLDPIKFLDSLGTSPQPQAPITVSRPTAFEAVEGQEITPARPLQQADLPTGQMQFDALLQTLDSSPLPTPEAPPPTGPRPGVISNLDPQGAMAKALGLAPEVSPTLPPDMGVGIPPSEGATRMAAAPTGTGGPSVGGVAPIPAPTSEGAIPGALSPDENIPFDLSQRPTTPLGESAGSQAKSEQIVGASVQGLANFLGDIPRGLATLEADLQRRALEAQGVDPALVPDPRTTALFKAGETLSQEAKEVAPTNPAFNESFFLNTLPSAGGSAAGFIATGVLGRLAGLPALLTASSAGGLSGASTGFKDALSKGASIEDAFTTSEYNAIIGLSEGLPISRFFDRLDKGLGGSIKRLLVDTIKQGTEEAFQEASQTILTNLVANQFVGYDPNRGTFEGAIEGGAAGFTLGGAMAFIGGLVFGGRRARIGPRSEQELLEMTRRGAAPPPPPPAQGELFPPDDLGIAPPIQGSPEQLPLPGIPAPPSPSEMGFEIDVDPSQLDFFDQSATTTAQQLELGFEERIETPFGAGFAVVPAGERLILTPQFSGDETGRLMSFEEAGAAVAELPPQGADIFQIDLLKLEQRQISSGLDFIPQKVTIEDPNVRFVGVLSPQGKVEAIGLVNQATAALARGEEHSARDLYNQAIARGFRFRPQPFGQIRLVEPVREGQFRRLAQLPVGPRLAPVFMSNGLVKSAQEIPGLAGTQALLLESKSVLNDVATKNPTGQRFFQFTEEGLTRADVTLSEPASNGAAQINAQGFVNNTFGLAETVQSLATRGVTFTPGADIPQAIKEIAAGQWGAAIASGARFRPTGKLPSIEAGRKLIALGGIQRSDVIEVAPLPDLGRGDPFASDQILGYYKVGAIASTKALADTIMNASGWKTIDGKLAPGFDGMGPVTVMGWGENGTQALGDPQTERGRANIKRWLKRIAKQYEQLMKEFGIKDQKLIIIPMEDPKHPMGTSWALGNAVDGVHIIHLNFVQDKSPKRRSATAFHEFGHFLEHVLLSQADMATVESLMHSFNRQSVAGRRTSGRRAAERLVSPETAEAFVDEGLFDKSPTWFRTWWDFDEWFAEQTVRWAFSSSRPVTLIDKFFKNISRLYLRSLEVLTGTKPGEFQAEIEFETFMQTMRDRAKFGLPPHSAPAINFAEIKSKADNAKAAAQLGIDTQLVPPQQAASYNAQQAAEVGLLEFGEFSRNEFKAGLDFYNRLVKWGFNVLQLAQKNLHISGLQRYVEQLDLAHNFKMNIVSNADRRVSEWYKAIPNSKQKPFSRYLFDLTEMKYLGPNETAARQPTAQEKLDLARRHDLNEADVAFGNLVIQDFEQFLNIMEDTFVLQARETFIENQQEMQREIARIRKQMSDFRSRPYIPMVRFGDFTIDVTDNVTGERLWFEQVESSREQGRRQRILQREFPNATVKVGVLQEQFKAFQGLPPQMIRAIVQMKVGNLTQQQREQLEALAFQFSPSQSFQKRLLRRKGVAGFEDDALRAYANYFFHGANNLMRVRFRSRLQGGIDQVRASARELSNRQAADPSIPRTQVNKRGQIANFLQQHLESFLNPKPDWATMRALAFQWHLGFALDSAVLNLTQVPMVAYPYLSSRFTDAAAARELGVAYTDVTDIYKATGANPRRVASVPQDEFKALERAMQEGFIDEGQATELAGLSEGSRLQRTLPGTPIGRFIKQASHWSGFMFQQAEMLNRRVVFRAAYRLMKQNPNVQYANELAETKALELSELMRDGFTQTQALAYLAGKDAVRRTQFEYAAWARPRFMQGKAATFFTFFNFLQNMLFFAAFSPGNARYLLILLASAGLMGLPGAEDLFDIADAAYKQLLKRGFFKGSGSLDVEVRKFINELGANPDLILHGVASKSYGMTVVGDAIGLPIPSVDFSRRVGLGRVVPGVEPIFGGRGRDFEQFIGGAGADVAGAAFAIPINILKALSDNHPDVYKRWARAMPRAAKNVFEAGRTLARGGVESRRGGVIVPFDVHNPDDLSEAIAKALGFNPTRTAKTWDARRMQQEVAMFWTTRKTMLMAQWDEARRLGDKEGIADVLSGIKEYNRTVPWPSMRLGPKSLRASLIQRMKSRMMEERGLLDERATVPMSNEILDLFPDIRRDMEERRLNRQRSGQGEVLEDRPVR